MNKFIKTYLFMLFQIALIANAASTEKEGDDILNFKFGLAGNSSNLQFKNSLISSGSQVSYETNTRGRMAFSLGYRNLGIGFGIPLSSSDTEKKGSSAMSEYSLLLLGRNTYSAGYQKSKGFFVKDSAQPGTGVYLQKPDLQFEKTYLQWMHNFYHEDLSLPAVFNYSGRQIESNWTILTFVQANRSTLSDEVSLIETSQQSKLPEFGLIKQIDRSSASAGLGLAGAVVLSHFQIAALITIGGSLEQKKFTDINNLEVSDSAGSSAVNAFINAGFNGKKHQLGTTVLVNSYSLKYKTESLDESTQEFKLFYGYRFDGISLGSTINTISSWLD